jgi:plasmid stability protein
VGVNLSIKGVPEALAERLRLRAARNHRSLQRELMAIVEEAAADPGASVALAPRVAAPAAPAYLLPPDAGGQSARTPSGAKGSDGLLAELDAIVAGSRWGHAGLLTREQAHDRRLQREFDYDARLAQAGGDRP